MSTDYKSFLRSKQAVPELSGFDVQADNLNSNLYLFQRDIVIWALRLGKSAIFAQVGMGKTIMQLEWANQVVKKTGKPVLILAPLAVAAQTIREGSKFGITVKRVNNQDESDLMIEDGHKILITNYEKLTIKSGTNKGDYRFDTEKFAGVVLDESSRIKNYTSRTKKEIELAFQDTPYKLACSATPAPNDHMELGNHAQFLDIMPLSQMLTKYFVHDSSDTAKWRLKGHAVSSFWKWLTSWAVCLTKPSDLGDEYDMPEYELPALNIIGHFVAANSESHKEAQSQGRLFADTAPSSTQLGKVKRKSLAQRIEKAKEIVASIGSHESILIWCVLNDEADALKKAFAHLDAVEVRGSDSDEKKESKLLGFSDKKHRILITKTKIAGHGMNWQHCHNAIFFGLDFSFESFYQAKGRNHRYGQTEEVNCHIVYSELEGNVTKTLERKQKDFERMQHQMAQSMQDNGLFRDSSQFTLNDAEQDTAHGKNWILHLGDSVEEIKNIPDESIGFSVYSPPFSSLYTYSNNQADMGNSSSDEEFFEHYKYLIAEKLRITKPGRLSAVHCSDLPIFKGKSGFIGMKDFSGDIIKAHEECGWIYHSRITIWKNPVLEVTRTKAIGLMHKQFKKDSAISRVGMPDYMLIFRKHGDNLEPIAQKRIEGDYIGLDIVTADRPHPDSYSINLWQRYASPVWMDISQGDVLSYRGAKSEKDEKHICPLQLDVIRRCIDLWSNKGDTVFTPFGGIGSELVSAITMGRKAIGIELKRNYWEQAVKHCEDAEAGSNRPNFFHMLDAGD